MSTQRHIIAGYDGSSAAAVAAEWAATEAVRRGCALTIIGCYSIPVAIDYGMSYGALPIANVDELRKYAEDGVNVLVEHLATTYPKLNAKAAALPGPASHVLVEQATNADLVVVGASGAGEISSLMLGSVAFTVSRTSPCPVVVVPSKHDPSSRRHIVVGVDTLETSREALDWAADEADLLGTDLTVVHAWDYPYATVPPDARARDLMQVDAACELDRAVEHLRERSGVDIERRLTEGDPADEILAASGGADLIVIGSRGRGSIRALFLGSTSNAVITHAPCPTVVVRHKG